MSFVSYAQNAEDVMLWRAMKDVSNGFYIDVGAFDPDEDSVTRAFYDRGWRGINIDPVEDCIRRFAAARPDEMNLQMALDRAAGEQIFYVIRQNGISGLSTLDAGIAADHAARGFEVTAHRVPVSTLAEVCLHHVRGTIHFLKIDVEGAEEGVLVGADFQRFRPWIVVVEATRPGTTIQTHEQWEHVLTNAAYPFVWYDGLNRYYVAEEKFVELSSHFKVPLNIFDDFVHYDAPITRKLGALERQVRERDSTLAEERMELAAVQTVLTRTRTELRALEEKQARLADHLARSQQDLTASRAARQAEEAERWRLEDHRECIQLQLVALTEDKQRLAGELDRVRYDLRWENGPRTVRIWLPAARLLRRLYGMPVPRDRPLAVTEAVPGGAPLGKRSPHRRSWNKRLALSAYWLVRPVVRPLAWRARSFLMQDLRRIEGLHTKLGDLQQAVVHKPLGPNEDAVLLQSIEDALLTLALHRSD